MTTPHSLLTGLTFQRCFIPRSSHWRNLRRAEYRWHSHVFQRVFLPFKRRWWVSLIFCLTNAYEVWAADFLLGDAFLRNVFSLYDLGNWTTVGTTAPFVKLLSVSCLLWSLRTCHSSWPCTSQTTDATQADSEFDSLNRARLARAQSAAQSKTGAKDAKDAKPHKAYYSSPTEYLYPTSSSSHSSPISHSSPSSFVQDPSGLTRNTFIIMGLLACIILMLILLVAGVLPTRGNKGYTGTVPLVQSKYNQYSRTSLDDTWIPGLVDVIFCVEVNLLRDAHVYERCW
jgi:hypothetical protein